MHSRLTFALSRACLFLLVVVECACTGMSEDAGGDGDDDAGRTDAGEFDAGALEDGGIPDAGSDGGEPDAGPPADFVLHGVPVRFLDNNEAQVFLESEDDFTLALSTFDRQVRIGALEPVSDVDFRVYLGEQAARFSSTEKARYLDALVDLDLALDGLELDLPDEIVVIKTTGDDEFGAPYTRRNAIIIPAGFITNNVGIELFLLAHELFHVLSRHQPSARDAFYGVLGFTPASGVENPPSLESGRLTNPDAYTLDHAIVVDDGLSERSVMPLYHWPDDLASALAAPNFLAALDYFLLVVEQDGDGSWAPVESDGGVVLLNPASTDYAARLGGNTTYIVHPEEVMAENFEIVVRKRLDMPHNVPSPEIVDELEAILLP